MDNPATLVIYLVFVCINVDDEPTLVAVRFQRDNAERYIIEHPIGTGFNYVIEAWEVPDYEVAERLDPVTAGLYQAAAEVNRKYA